MQVKEITAANRASWNEAASIHAQTIFEKLAHSFQTPHYSCLDRVVGRLLQTAGLNEGKAVAHLCCNNGRELLSIKNMGAGHCVGFDISDEFIGQANHLKRMGNIDCKFVRTDIYDLPLQYNNQFDIVFVSVGTLGWMPDLEDFFAVATRLLREGGQLLIYEMHPILDMFEPDDFSDTPTLRHSYFRHDPYIEQISPVYAEYDVHAYYWFHHKLSDIFTALLQQNMTIAAFEEYGHDVSAVFSHFQDLYVKPPLAYTLMARK
jgi:ubiquinone/menaquinone biosynthesis C-methylase UbiE